MSNLFRSSALANSTDFHLSSLRPLLPIGKQPTTKKKRQKTYDWVCTKVRYHSYRKLFSLNNLALKTSEDNSRNFQRNRYAIRVFLEPALWVNSMRNSMHCPEKATETNSLFICVLFLHTLTQSLPSELPAFQAVFKPQTNIYIYICISRSEYTPHT